METTLFVSPENTALLGLVSGIVALLVVAVLLYVWFRPHHVDPSVTGPTRHPWFGACPWYAFRIDKVANNIGDTLGSMGLQNMGRAFVGMLPVETCLRWRRAVKLCPSLIFF